MHAPIMISLPCNDCMQSLAHDIAVRDDEHPARSVWCPHNNAALVVLVQDRVVVNWTAFHSRSEAAARERIKYSTRVETEAVAREASELIARGSKSN